MGRPESRQQEGVYLKNKQIYDIIRWGIFFPIGIIQEGARVKNSKHAGWHMRHNILNLITDTGTDK